MLRALRVGAWSRPVFMAAALGLATAAAAAALPVVFLPIGGATGASGTGGASGANAAPGGNPLRAGQVVEIQWIGTPPQVAELELLLSLDGGRHFKVRVTPDLDGDRGSYTWHVPPFPSDRAQLAVRGNLGGHEIVLGRSALFRIAGDGRARPWSARARGGDLWVTGNESDADASEDDDDHGSGPLSLGGGSPVQLAAALPGPAPLPPPAPRLAAPSGIAASCWITLGRTVPAAPSADARHAAAFSTPLRI